MSEEAGGSDRMSEEMAQQLRAGPSRGSLMRIAREKAGLSVQQLANGMNLSQKQIMALESDDLAALPSATFVRGFVRNYARIVGCDPYQFEGGEVLGAEKSESSSFTLSPPAENMPIHSNRADSNRRWMIAAGVIVVIGLIGGYVRWEHVEQARSLIIPQTENTVAAAPKLSAEDQPAANALNAAAPVTVEAAPVGSVPASPSTAASSPLPASAVPTNPIALNAASSNTVPAQAGPAANSPALTKAAELSKNPDPAKNSEPGKNVLAASLAPSASAPSKVAATDTDTAATAAAAATAANGVVSPPRLDPSLPAFPVVLNVSQESWVDVREIGGKVFVHGMVKAGERREFQARGQVKVVIGNAPGVSLSWKGKAMDLTDSTKDSVAKLILEPDAE